MQSIFQMTELHRRCEKKGLLSFCLPFFFSGFVMVHLMWFDYLFIYLLFWVWTTKKNSLSLLWFLFFVLSNRRVGICYCGWHWCCYYRLVRTLLLWSAAALLLLVVFFGEKVPTSEEVVDLVDDHLYDQRQPEGDDDAPWGSCHDSFFFTALLFCYSVFF